MPKLYVFDWSDEDTPQYSESDDGFSMSDSETTTTYTSFSSPSGSHQHRHHSRRTSNISNHGHNHSHTLSHSYSRRHSKPFLRRSNDLDHEVKYYYKHRYHSNNTSDSGDDSSDEEIVRILKPLSLSPSHRFEYEKNYDPTERTGSTTGQAGHNTLKSALRSNKAKSPQVSKPKLKELKPKPPCLLCDKGEKKKSKAKTRTPVPWL